MVKNEIIKIMRKYVVWFTFLVIALVVLINGSYMLMTWLIRDIIGMEHVYLSSELQFLGTLVFALIGIIIIFSIIYRRRKRELTRLSEAIEKVANGDFSIQITYNKRDPMGHVYSNFNQMIRELNNVQVLRNDFINSFSHEFKTPIASINGFASLMLDKHPTPEEQATYLTIIKDESERLSRLTSNTILMTKLASQEIVYASETYDLGEQLRQCAILLSQEWLKKKIDFSGDFPSVHYQGNREFLQHVWINLLNNAIKYTPVGGEISMSLVQKDNQAIVTVSDTGEGMDETTLAHLFDAYYQGDSSHSRQGLGLGLSIASRIIELSGGTISVQSIQKEGSTFTVSLPLIKTS